MTRPSSRFVIVLMVLTLIVPAVLASTDSIPLNNWAVPSRSGGVSALADTGGAGAFVPMIPCRVVDTRNAVGAFGGPIYTAGQQRNYSIPAGPCTGIPTGVSAYS